MSKGLVVNDPVQKLLTCKDYAVEMVNLIIKKTDLEPYAGYTMEDLRALCLYDLSRVQICHFKFLILCISPHTYHFLLSQTLVWMKALQDRCEAHEGMIHQFRKCQEIENKERAQYVEAICTLNKDLMAKTTVLAKETHRHREVEKAKSNLETELATLCEQVEKAMADTVVEFQVFQPFINACGVYYGDEFNDHLKQVVAAYPNLDLSHITINNTVPPTLEGDDIVNNESIDSVHTVEQKVQDTNGVVITQPSPKGLYTIVVLFVVDPSTADGSFATNPTDLDAPPS